MDKAAQARIEALARRLRVAAELLTGIENAEIHLTYGLPVAVIEALAEEFGAKLDQDAWADDQRGVTIIVTFEVPVAGVIIRGMASRPATSTDGELLIEARVAGRSTPARDLGIDPLQLVAAASPEAPHE